jgi:hypothetical protein
MGSGGQVVFSTRDEKHNHFADFKIPTKLGQTVRYSTDSTERVQLVPKFQMGEEVVCSTFHPTPSPADLRKDENNWPNERADVQQFHLLFLKCSSAVWSVQSARIKQIVLEVAFEWVRKGVMTLVTSGLVRSYTYADAAQQLNVVLEWKNFSHVRHAADSPPPSTRSHSEWSILREGR